MAKRLLKRKITEMDDQRKDTPENAESIQLPTVDDSGGHSELCPAGHIVVKDEEYWTPLVRVGSEGEQMGMIKCFGKFEVAECLIPMDLNRVKKEIWKESLLMLAEHTLFDHSRKEPVVEYQEAERDFVMEKPVCKIYPVQTSSSLSSKLNYRESTKISSSESDGSSVSKKVRETLDTHKPPLFPLIPDFSEFRQPEIEGYPLKLSSPKPIHVDSKPEKEIASDMKDLDLAQKTDKQDSVQTPDNNTVIISRGTEEETTRATKIDPILEQLWKLPRIKPAPATESRSSDTTDDDLTKISD